MKDDEPNSSRNAFSKPRSSHVRAKKSFGQNFLEDKSVVERIVSSVAPNPNETIVEIGPGRGALTSRLVETPAQLVAIEFDRDLIPLLKKKFGSEQNFTLIEGDALLIDLCSAIAPAASARLVANLPYYISTAILQRLLEQRACLTELTLMLQREVADRITAPPATSERGYLSVLIEAYADVEKLFDVAPSAFRPAPKVWSTVVRVVLRKQIRVQVTDERVLWQIVSVGFAQRRKTILNNLRNAQARFPDGLLDQGRITRALESSGIAPQRRAETLTLEEWAQLANAFGVR
jgi:16S rRNA (adenine1518-N6/adenine1519-N6)-dimethyltransferase